MGTNPSTGETWFPIDPGKSNASAVRSCLDGWIDSGATVLLPIYDLVTGNGNNAGVPHHRRRGVRADVALAAGDRQHPGLLRRVLPVYGRARRRLGAAARDRRTRPTSSAW